VRVRLLTVMCVLSFIGTAAAESVLVFGATGHTGSRIVKHLVTAGHDVTAFVRPTSSRTRLTGYDATYAVGDVTEPATVEAAFEHAKPDVVVAVMQSRRGQPSPHGEPEVRLVKLAEKYDADQFIYLSSVGAGPDTPEQRALYPDINFDLFAAGLAEKGRVEKALRDSQVAFTIIRSGSILVEFGREPPPGTGRGYLTEDESVTGPITYDDLAILMARCVASSGCYGKTYHATDDTLWPEYNHWRCRRFAPSDQMDAACDHLRPIGQEVRERVN
jgi:uncharacterized protein YbjT (DUF2867 family)